MLSTGNSTVDAIGNFNFEGNIIPVNWFSTFKLSNGKPDVNAIIILSEIVYWHRPSVIRDEETGQITGIKKKFKADLLQRSYGSFSDQFGLTKIQVRDALDRLENFGVIKKYFRTITVNNTKLNNVLFIDLITPVLFKVTTLSSYNLGGYQVINAEAPHLELDTNTKTTTEITTESLGANASNPPKSKFSAKKALKDLGVSNQTIAEYIETRTKKKKTITETVIKLVVKQAEIAGISCDRAFKIIAVKNWDSFKASYAWQEINAELDQLDKPVQPQPEQQKPQIKLPAKPKGFLGGAQ